MTLEFNLDPGLFVRVVFAIGRQLGRSAKDLSPAKQTISVQVTETRITSHWSCRSERARTFVGKPSPMAMAQAIVLLPVPFGPMIMLRAGPGRNSTLSYVRNEWQAMRVIDPVT